jgi:pseudouridine synthase
VIPFRDVVRLDGNIIQGWEAMNALAPANAQEPQSALEYIKYWKPCGVTCTTDRSIPSNILDRLEQDGYRPDHRVFPVGRLDKETSGLILLTSDGRFPNSSLRGRYKQPKTYEVLVNDALTDDEIQRLRDGVVITTQAQRDGKRALPLTARTMPCIVETPNDKRRLKITLVEGRNRQIRRMIASLDPELRVVELHRCEFMRISLAPLRGPGDWAPLSPKELEMVLHVISSAEQERETMESW